MCFTAFEKSPKPQLLNAMLLVFDCRGNEPLTVNATSFTAGDVIVVSWNFTRTTVAATDVIQASYSCYPSPSPCPCSASLSVQQTVGKCLESQTQLCLLPVRSGCSCLLPLPAPPWPLSSPRSIRSSSSQPAATLQAASRELGVQRSIPKDRTAIAQSWFLHSAGIARPPLSRSAPP